MERFGVDSVGKFHVGFYFRSARFGDDQQVFGRVSRGEILRRERVDRQGGEFVPKESFGSVSFGPGGVGSERPIFVWLSGELSSVHGVVEPRGQNHGLGLAARWPLVARFPNRRQEDFRHVYLLQLDAVQIGRIYGFDRLR